MELDPAVIAFGSALLGALVGGFVASWGSLVVARRVARFEARLRMYQELVPQFEPSRFRGSFINFPRKDRIVVETGSKPLTTDEVIESMERTAVVAGRRETKLVANVRAAWEKRQERPSEDDPRWQPTVNTQTGEVIRQKGSIDRSIEDAAVKAALDALDARLKKKLR